MDIFIEPLEKEPTDSSVQSIQQELARHSEILAGFLFDVATEAETRLTLGIRCSRLVDARDQAEIADQIEKRFEALRFSDDAIAVIHLDDDALRRILAIATPVFYRDAKTLEREDTLVAAEFHFTRGNDLDDDDKRSEAIAEWEQAIDLDSNHIGARYNLGIAYSEQDRPELAMEQLRQVVKLDPFDLDATHDLADLLLQEGKVDEAIQVLRQSLSSNPRDRESALELATIYIDNDLLDEAFGALDEAAGALDFESTMEQDAELWFELGQAYAERKRSDDAILAYRRAVVANNHAGAIAALQNLRVTVEEEPDEEEEE